MGTVPLKVDNWFKELGERSIPIDTRSDMYLHSHSPTVGVKLRQGNLELKYRQQNFGKVTIADRESQIERWSKWICDDPQAQTPMAISDRTGWIEVAKRRDRRLYSVEFAPAVVLTQIAAPTAGVAAIELTQIQVRGRNWWTVGCEYFGDNIDVDRQFLPLVTALQSDFPGDCFSPFLSCGYPQWLSQI